MCCHGADDWMTVCCHGADGWLTVCAVMVLMAG